MTTYPLTPRPLAGHHPQTGSIADDAVSACCRASRAARGVDQEARAGHCRAARSIQRAGILASRWMTESA